MTYDKEIHQLVNEFILDILLKNCEWLLKWDGQEIIYAGVVLDDLASVKTITKRTGFVREYLIQHTNGIPEKYSSQRLCSKINCWNWTDFPDWRTK